MASTILFPHQGKKLDFAAFTSDELWRKLSKTSSPERYAVLSYKHPTVRALVWQIKYKKNNDAIRHGGYILSKAIQMKTNPIIIPIPISPARRRERGYNQCELLAKATQQHLSNQSYQIEIRTDILIRPVHTERQTLRNRAERLHNMHGVFSVTEKYAAENDATSSDSDFIKNRSVIILDDVITTGSTTHEAYATLERAGFKHISILALAH